MSEQAIAFPLRSNAKSLVAGAPVDSVRRKLKYASLLYGSVILEAGILRLNAGPGGSFSVVEQATQDEPPAWESAAARRRAQQRPFALAMGREATPGGLVTTMSTVLQSDPAIAWTATLEPFSWEIPAAVNWIEFTRWPNQLPTPIDRLARQWARADEDSDVLAQTVPVPRVREVIIRNANHDLAVATGAGIAAAMDPLHAQVVNQRFQDDVSWHAQGFALPIRLPQVGDLGWEEIIQIRANRQITRFRQMMNDVEAEVRERSAGEGLEAAVRRVYDRELGRAIGEIEGVGAAASRALQVIAFGIGGGLATMGFVGLGGLAGGATIGAAAGGIIDVRKVIKRRRSSGWATVHQQILGTG